MVRDPKALGKEEANCPCEIKCKISPQRRVLQCEQKERDSKVGSVYSYWINCINLP